MRAFRLFLQVLCPGFFQRGFMENLAWEAHFWKGSGHQRFSPALTWCGHRPVGSTWRWMAFSITLNICLSVVIFYKTILLHLHSFDTFQTVKAATADGFQRDVVQNSEMRRCTELIMWKKTVFVFLVKQLICFWHNYCFNRYLYSRIPSKKKSLIKTTMSNLFLIKCTCEVFHDQTTQTVLLQKSDRVCL